VRIVIGQRSLSTTFRRRILVIYACEKLLPHYKV